VSIWSDLRFAWRSLGRQPAFTATSVATLAVGIGAATAMFTVVNAVLLKPLPYPDPARLGILHIESTNGEGFPLPDADFLAWRAAHPGFDHVAVYASSAFTLTGSGAPEVIRGAWVSGEFFTTLGVQPVAGRLFQSSDEVPGSANVVVIGHSFWMRRFGGRPEVVGSTLRLNDVPCTIVGIVPASMTFPGPDADVWENRVFRTPSRRGPFYLMGLARLDAQTSFQAAKPRIDTLASQVKRQYGGPSNWQYNFLPMAEATTAGLGKPLYFLLAAVGVLLLIAVANVANLQLARGSARQRELALRAALGASRVRLARLVLVEAALLGTLGGGLGALIAVGLTRFLITMGATEIPQLTEVRGDWRVLAFITAVSCAATLLSAWWPALQASKGDAADPLRDGQRGGTSGSRRRAQRILVVAEIGLALVLSIGAGLFVRSLIRLQEVDAGITPEGLLTFQLSLPSTRYRDDAASRAFYNGLLSRIEAVPGVRSAALAVSLPPDQLTMTDNFTPEGRTYVPGESAPVGPLVFASAEYFRTLGIPLLRGRLFDARDSETSERVVIVSRALANRYYPGGDAIGRMFRIGGPERPDSKWMRIVGIVGDVRYDGLAQEAAPAYYLPFEQNPWSDEYVAIRTTVSPASIVPAVRSAVWSIDGNLPLERLRTMDELMSGAAAGSRFRTLILSGFGAAGLLLALVGVYGVMSHAMSQRTHEMGVRAALGAQRRDLVGLVLKDVGVLIAAGVGLGLIAAFVFTRAAEALLFGIAPRDPLTFAAAAIVLAATAAVAGWLPARRVSSISPLVALRDLRE
jgi:predicted permease